MEQKEDGKKTIGVFKMVKISVKEVDNKKIYKAGPFDAYVAKATGNYYYIQLARGTNNMNRDVANTTFDKKSDATKVIKEWLNARYMIYEGKLRLDRLKK